jgi:uncharacterized protein (UPF0332 family)
MYYACFYAIGALLIKNGISTSSHAGLRQRFGKEFVKTGKIDKELAKHFSDTDFGSEVERSEIPIHREVQGSLPRT